MLPHVPTVAAEDCLTAPTGDKADGQHWRYRLERGHRCWYLKDSAAAARNSADDVAPRQANQPNSAWDFAQPTPPKLTTRRSNGPVPRANTEALADGDARAAASGVRTRPATSFDDSLQRSTAAPSWQPLDSADMDSQGPGAFASPPDEPAPAPDPAASTPPPDAPAATPVKPVKPVAPIRKLLMVVVGALALSGLLASALYRLSKAGRRRRRNRNWQRAIARARRNRDKPRSKSKIVKSNIVHASGRAAKRPKMAPAAKRAVPMPAPVIAVAPKPAVAAPPAADDPAAELVGLLASRGAKTAPPQAEAPPSRPAKPLPETIPVPAPAGSVDPAAELIDLLGSHAAKRAAQSPAAEAAQPPAPPPVEAVPAHLPLVADPAAELANLLESRFAPPPPSARQAATPARPQPPAAPVNPAAPKVVDPIAELAHLLEAKEIERAARFGNADAFGRNSPPPAAKPITPAAELFDRMEARAAGAAPPRADEPQPAKAVQPPEPAKQEPVKPSRPETVMAPRRKKAAPPVRIDSAPAGGMPAAEPIAPIITPRIAVAKPDRHEVDSHKVASSKADRKAPKSVTSKTVTSKTAAPKAGKDTRRDDAAPRRKGTELPPLPPALMLEPENNGPTPPLDFIPRPQALRPRLRDISQDESLDGVQDILARLAKHG